MTTPIGAAWAHGDLPPWMQAPPGFDEADAADRAQATAEWMASPAAQLAERFGDLGGLDAERNRLPRPPALAELAARRGNLPNPALHARRRAVLEAALDTPEDLPAALDHGRRAA